MRNDHSTSPGHDGFFYGREGRRHKTLHPNHGNMGSANTADDFFAKAIRLNVSGELVLAIEHRNCFCVNKSTDVKQLSANFVRVG
jgi:hypothetical protein